MSKRCLKKIGCQKILSTIYRIAYIFAKNYEIIIKVVA
jgi:hypothetical protein